MVIFPSLCNKLSEANCWFPDDFGPRNHTESLRLSHGMPRRRQDSSRSKRLKKGNFLALKQKKTWTYGSLLENNLFPYPGLYFVMFLKKTIHIPRTK
jgi:hypothetical protein